METVTLTVTGMTCSGCENAITRALSTLPGVHSVEASHRTGSVTLRVDPATFDRTAATAKVQKIGYAARE